jgi:hypothetical protein
VDERRRAGGEPPGELELGQGGDLGEAGDGEGEGRQGGEGGARARGCAERVVEEDFVGEEGDLAGGEQGVEEGELVRVEVIAGGVVGGDDDEGAGAGRGGEDLR